MFKDQISKMYRNKLKKEYAFAYRRFMQSGYQGQEPERGALSYMAAQAVRIDLEKMYGEIYPDNRPE